MAFHAWPARAILIALFLCFLLTGAGAATARRPRRERNSRASVDGAVPLAARKKPAPRHTAGPRLRLSRRTRIA